MNVHKTKEPVCLQKVWLDFVFRRAQWMNPETIVQHAQWIQHAYSNMENLPQWMMCAYSHWQPLSTLTPLPPLHDTADNETPPTPVGLTNSHTLHLHKVNRGSMRVEHSSILPLNRSVAWVTLKVGTSKWEMRNGKWENGEMGRRLRKSISMYSSLPDSWHKRGMQQHCIMVCKLILSSSSLVSFLEVYWICELFILSNFIQGVKFEISSCSNACIVMGVLIFVSHTALLFKTARLLY